MWINCPGRASEAIGAADNLIKNVLGATSSLNKIFILIFKIVLAYLIYFILLKADKDHEINTSYSVLPSLLFPAGRFAFVIQSNSLANVILCRLRILSAPSSI